MATIKDGKGTIALAAFDTESVLKKTGKLLVAMRFVLLPTECKTKSFCFSVGHRT